MYILCDWGNVICACRDKETAIRFRDAIAGTSDDHVGYYEIPYFEGNTKPVKVKLYKAIYLKDHSNEPFKMFSEEIWNFKIQSTDIGTQMYGDSICVRGKSRSSVILEIQRLIEEYKNG